MRRVVDTRSEFEHLAGIYVAVAVAVVVVVIGAILFTVVRFRRRDDEPPAQRERAPLLEMLYATGLAAVVVVLLALTFHTQGRVDRLSPDPGLRVDVTAAKWNWAFDSAGVVSRNALTVPSDTTIRFSLTSLDVIHSLWCPGARFKRDAFPKRTTQFDLVFDRPGIYTCRCAEFCGLDHGVMRFSVEVLPPDEFEARRA
jgi:cytochrome c oxidase subunit II